MMHNLSIVIPFLVVKAPAMCIACITFFYIVSSSTLVAESYCHRCAETEIIHYDQLLWQKA